MISLTIQLENPSQVTLVAEALRKLLTPSEVAAPATEVPATPKKRKSAAATPVADETPVATPETVTESPSDPKPAAAPSEPETPVAPPASAPASITLEQVRGKLAALSQSGKMAEVKALISDLGYAKLTDVPADRYADLMDKAEAL